MVRVSGVCVARLVQHEFRGDGLTLWDDSVCMHLLGVIMQGSV